MVMGSSRNHAQSRRLAEKVTLADVDAGHAQQIVSRRQVEIIVRQYEVQEIILARHLRLDVGADRKHDLTLGAGLKRSLVERAQEGQRLLDARLQFIERRLGVLEARRLDAGQTPAAVFGLIAERLNLARESLHVRP